MTTEHSRAPQVSMEGVTRRFGRTLANDNIDLTLIPASIHALVGENGAGKSTLMRILYGLLRCDDGRTLIDGRPVAISSPAQALERGIGMIHQHFMLVPTMTVLENVVLGAPGMRGLRRLPREQLARDLKGLFQSYGFDLDPKARVDSLGVGGRQRVEIARMLYRGVRLLICDEPTAVLAPPEVASLFGILRRFREEGRTIVFITHKLPEVLEIADRVTVLRRGRVVGEAEGQEINRDRLVRWIMGDQCSDGIAAGPREGEAGGELAVPRGAREARSREVAGEASDDMMGLETRDLGLLGPGDRPLLQDVSLSVGASEILGVAGVAGNGQRELAEVVSGLRRFSQGRLRVGRVWFEALERVAPERRPALIPEDRSSEGLIGTFRLWENLLMGRTGEVAFARPYWYAHQSARAWAMPILRRFRIDPADPEAPADALSGGNQQKVLCAREMSRGRSVLVACQPTRGIDLVSTAFLHQMLREFRERGGSVLLFSADLDEILALSDRVAVIYRGRLGEMVPRAELDLASVGRAMVGVAE